MISICWRTSSSKEVDWRRFCYIFVYLFTVVLASKKLEFVVTLSSLLDYFLVFFSYRVCLDYASSVTLSVLVS